MFETAPEVRAPFFTMRPGEPGTFARRGRRDDSNSFERELREWTNWREFEDWCACDRGHCVRLGGLRSLL